MAKLSEDLITGRMAPWRNFLYQKLTPFERETLKEAYELEEKAAQEEFMAKTKATKQRELETEITRVNASLESPKLVFTIADLKEDPLKFQSDLVDFLRRHTGDEISLIGSSKLQINSPWSTAPSSTSKMNFSAKVKWSLASMEVINANGKFTVTVQVPIE